MNTLLKIAIVAAGLLSGTNLFAQLKPFYSDTNDKYGYKDTSGQTVVTPKFDLAYTFTEGMAAVRLNGKYGYINEKGELVVEPKYDFTWQFIGGYATVKLGDKYGFINKSGKVVIAPIYDEANNYHCNCCYKGQAHVKENGKWKIIVLPK